MMPSTQVEVKDRLPLSCLLSRFDDAREVSQNKTIVQSSLLRACPSPSLSSILPVIIKKRHMRPAPARMRHYCTYITDKF